jgi:(S)-ureidoglycine aminohydrolase
MRPHHLLVHSRTRVRSRYALMPLEGFPLSRVPGWPAEAEVRVLASPELGARFVQMLIDLPAGRAGEFASDDRIETFYYVISGAGSTADHPGQRAGSFGLIPPGQPLRFSASEPTRLLIHRKRYQPAPGVTVFEPLFGHESQVAAEPWAETDKIRLQTLVPDDMKYDLAMNIFRFTPGFGLPIVETHVMEHGLLFLAGKGVYYLDGEWMEVEKDDFIWMGPYCPQSFYATGAEPARYLYYKDVNREIAL